MRDVDAKSVAELVRIRLDRDEADTWRLSVVQRAAVWDSVRAAYLLDSLLLGYPIGALLTCSVKETSHVLVPDGGLRLEQVAGPDTLQLLDGQQRLNALAWLFAGEPKGSGSFFVHMTAVRNRPEVTKRRKAKREELAYIRLGEGALRASDEKLSGARDQWLNLSGWNAFAEANTLPDSAKVTRADLFRMLSAVDPMCDLSKVDEGRAAVAEARGRALLQVWAKQIPVQHVFLEGPRDVLQVFSRINLAGVAIAGEDVFFAGVKTLWPDAEEHVDGFRQENALINRRGALRVIARLANYRVHGSDLLPLDVERLHGERGQALISCMRQIGGTNSPEKARCKEVADWLVSKSGLGYGLRAVPSTLLDQVYAWAVNRREWPPTEGQLAQVAGYLVGATALRYSQVFDEMYQRRAFALALEAGAQNSDFPILAILGYCRETWPSLKKARQQVAATSEDHEKRSLANDNYRLFLPIIQGIPYSPSADLEWEHIFAQDLAKKHMKWNGANGEHRRKRFYPCSNEAWQIGNLMALDGERNRAVSNKWPSQKRALYAALASDKWPHDLGVSDEEWDLLLRAEELLLKQGRVAEGMPLFHQCTRGRTLRIYAEVLTRYPELAWFARDFRLPEEQA